MILHMLDRGPRGRNRPGRRRLRRPRDRRRGARRRRPRGADRSGAAVRLRPGARRPGRTGPRRRARRGGQPARRLPDRSTRPGLRLSSPRWPTRRSTSAPWSCRSDDEIEADDRLLRQGRLRLRATAATSPPRCISPASRSPGALGPRWHHVGIYAYRRAALDRYVALPPSPLERREKLEQLRALEDGMRIACVRVEHGPFGVDTPEDLERARARCWRPQ